MHGRYCRKTIVVRVMTFSKRSCACLQGMSEDKLLVVNSFGILYVCFVYPGKLVSPFCHTAVRTERLLGTLDFPYTVRQGDC